jgi:hypothetical protein
VARFDVGQEDFVPSKLGEECCHERPFVTVNLDASFEPFVFVVFCQVGKDSGWMVRTGRAKIVTIRGSGQ